MSIAAAEWIVAILLTYAVAGVLFAIPFLSAGISKIDFQARDTGLGFRLIVLPGVVVFWPLFLHRWLRRGLR